MGNIELQSGLAGNLSPRYDNLLRGDLKGRTDCKI